MLNPLRPNSDEHQTCHISPYHISALYHNSDQHQISPHHISALYHIQVMRIKEMMKRLDCLSKFSQLMS